MLYPSPEPSLYSKQSNFWGQPIASTYSTSPERRLVRHLHDEVLAFSTAFQKVSLGVQHWNAVTNQLDAWKKQILEFEEMTRPLAEALAAAVMYADGQLDEAVLRSLKEVCQVVTTWPGNQSITDSEETTRAYPLSLLLFIVFTASLRTNRGTLLKHIASQTSRQFHHDRLWMYELRYLGSLDERFEAAFNIDSCAPAYQRLHDVVVGDSGWLSLELPFGEAKELGLKADLLLSLVLTDYDISLRESGPGTEFSGSTPIPNVLLYKIGASEVVRDLFKNHRPLLTSALKNTPEGVYAEVSRSSQSYTRGNRMRCWSQLSLDALTNK